MQREQFTFYRSFWEALKALPKKDQLPFVMAICAYAFGEESKNLTGQASAAFLLVRPILDKASKKAANGKLGGSKKKANAKQTESHIEGEGENEIEGEYECIKDHAVASVTQAYLDRVNPMASQTSLEELAAYAVCIGPDCCLRAIDIALDEKKATWSYIRAILRDKQAQGVRCIADWDALDAQRAQGANAQKTSQGRKSWAELAAEMDAEEGVV